MLLSDTIVDFYLFYDGAVDIQIWALLTRSQCKVSDTQVTVKACGPLVKINIGHNFKIINIRALILHMNISCDKIILLVSRYLSLGPRPSLELAIIGGICVSQTHLVLFRKIGWHLRQLISYKNVVLNMLFFLLQSLQYLYSHIYLWTKTWKFFIDEHFLKQIIKVMYRYVLNSILSFIWGNKKIWKNLDLK